jgi:hypothetical protein
MISFAVILTSCATKVSQIQLPSEIPWTESGLEWNNFQEVISVPKSPALARTVTKIYYQFSDSVIIQNDTGKIAVWVHSVMLPPKSYVKSSANRIGLLEHEQIHFDINEICARKFRKALTEAFFKLSSAKGEVYKLLQKYLTEMKELNRKYDLEHRDKNFGHRYWRRDMDYQLSVLKEYAGTEVAIKASLK